MIMRRILECALVSVALVTANCSLLSDPAPGPTPESNTNSRASAPVKMDSEASSPDVVGQLKWTGAKASVEAAIKKVNTTKGSAQQPTLNQVQEDVQRALNQLGGDKSDLEVACLDCSDDAKKRAREARDSLIAVRTELGKRTQKIADLDPELKADVLKNLENASSMIEAAKKASISAASAGPSSSDKDSGSEAQSRQSEDEPSWAWLLLPAKILGAVILLFVVGAGLLSLRQRSWNKVEAHLKRVLGAHVTAAKEQQADFAGRLSSLVSNQSQMSNRLDDIQTEVRSLARLVRESSIERGDRRQSPIAPISYAQVDQPTAKEEPAFPVSADDYLGKMKRFANIVRPDFQNGILVNDPDGKGELILIRDSRLPDETQPLFVVPRATQFQTKQDFYTYYEKYYDCATPSAGDVWIIDPAVVSKVSGGWLLREKGVLEIR
jgi:hypothetical protein